MATSENDIGQPKKHWTTSIGQAAGHPAAFAFVLLYAGLWLTFDAATFEWNAVATLAVWVMTLFIQRSNRRDTLALHAKLDELLRVDNEARSELTRLDEQEPEVIEQHRGPNEIISFAALSISIKYSVFILRCVPILGSPDRIAILKP